MIPTLQTTLALKGHRPVVGNWDGHDVVDVFGALNLVTGHLRTRSVERPRASSGQRPLAQRRLEYRMAQTPATSGAVPTAKRQPPAPGD